MLPRALLLSVFVLAGVHKALTFDATVRSFAEKAPWAPHPGAVIAAVVALETLAPLLAAAEPLLGARAASLRRASALALIAFTAAATAIYHPPKLAAGYMGNLSLVRNVSLMGGLLLLHGLPARE